MVAFAADMVLALAAIGTDEHARQPVRDVSEPEGADALPMSDDVFLDARFAVVAAGHEAWHRVVVDPAAFAGEWHVADGELLLALVQEAHDEVVEEDWSPDGVVYSLDSWLDWRGGIDLGVPQPAAHAWAWGWVLEALGKDEAWAQWWATSGRSQLRVDEIMTPHPWYATTVRRRKDRVDVAAQSSCAELHTDDTTALVRAALTQIQGPILAAAHKLRMTPTPAWPTPPPVPDLSDLERNLSNKPGIEDRDKTEAWMRDEGYDPAEIAAYLADLDRNNREIEAAIRHTHE